MNFNWMFNRPGETAKADSSPSGAETELAETGKLVMVLARASKLLNNGDGSLRAVGDFATSLRVACELRDAKALRACVAHAVRELETFVHQRKQVGHSAGEPVQAKLAGLEARLEEQDKRHPKDKPTGLSNRAHLMRFIEWRIENGKPFPVSFFSPRQSNLLLASMENRYRRLS